MEPSTANSWKPRLAKEPRTPIRHPASRPSCRHSVYFLVLASRLHGGAQDTLVLPLRIERSSLGLQPSALTDRAKEANGVSSRFRSGTARFTA